MNSAFRSTLTQRYPEVLEFQLLSSTIEEYAVEQHSKSALDGVWPQ